MCCFAVDLTALQTAELCGLNRNTVNRIYRGLRERILAVCEAQRSLFGVVEVDESFFGARRVKGKRGRGAYGKTVVFGIFERQGQVYSEIVSDCSKPTLQGIIRGKVDPTTVINSDKWRGYNGLPHLGYGHYRVEHSQNEFVRGHIHINGIEGFWGMAKVRLTKFRGNSNSRRPSGATTTEKTTTAFYQPIYGMNSISIFSCTIFFIVFFKRAQ